MTVIHQIKGWIIKFIFDCPLSPAQQGNFLAFMSELGIHYEPDISLQMVFWSLARQSPVAVMRRYQVAVVSHGKPDVNELEALRQQITKGLDEELPRISSLLDLEQENG